MSDLLGVEFFEFGEDDDKVTLSSSLCTKIQNLLNNWSSTPTRVSVYWEQPKVYTDIVCNSDKLQQPCKATAQVNTDVKLAASKYLPPCEPGFEVPSDISEHSNDGLVNGDNVDCSTQQDLSNIEEPTTDSDNTQKACTEEDSDKSQNIPCQPVAMTLPVSVAQPSVIMPPVPPPTVMQPHMNVHAPAFFPGQNFTYMNYMQPGIPMVNTPFTNMVPAAMHQVPMVSQTILNQHRPSTAVVSVNAGDVNANQPDTTQQAISSHIAACMPQAPGTGQNIIVQAHHGMPAPVAMPAFCPNSASMYIPDITRPPPQQIPDTRRISPQVEVNKDVLSPEEARERRVLYLSPDQPSNQRGISLEDLDTSEAPKMKPITGCGEPHTITSPQNKACPSTTPTTPTVQSQSLQSTPSNTDTPQSLDGILNEKSYTRRNKKKRRPTNDNLEVSNSTEAVTSTGNVAASQTSSVDDTASNDVNNKHEFPALSRTTVSQQNTNNSSLPTNAGCVNQPGRTSCTESSSIDSSSIKESCTLGKKCIGDVKPAVTVQESSQSSCRSNTPWSSGLATTTTARCSSTSVGSTTTAASTVAGSYATVSSKSINKLVNNDLTDFPALGSSSQNTPMHSTNNSPSYSSSLSKIASQQPSSSSKCITPPMPSTCSTTSRTISPVNTSLPSNNNKHDGKDSTAWSTVTKQRAPQNVTPPQANDIAVSPPAVPVCKSTDFPALGSNVRTTDNVALSCWGKTSAASTVPANSDANLASTSSSTPASTHQPIWVPGSRTTPIIATPRCTSKTTLSTSSKTISSTSKSTATTASKCAITTPCTSNVPVSCNNATSAGSSWGPSKPSIPASNATTSTSSAQSAHKQPTAAEPTPDFPALGTSSTQGTQHTAAASSLSQQPRVTPAGSSWGPSKPSIPAANATTSTSSAQSAHKQPTAAAPSTKHPAQLDAQPDIALPSVTPTEPVEEVVPVEQSKAPASNVWGKKPAAGGWSALFKGDSKGIVIATASPQEKLEPVAVPVAASDDTEAKQLGRLLSSLSLKHEGVSILPRGLVNRGNWCYINGTLQALLACPPFYHLLTALPNLPPEERGQTSTPVMDSLIEFAGQFSLFKDNSPLKATKPTEKASKSTEKLPSRKEQQNNKLPADLFSGIPFEPKNVYRMLQVIKSESEFKHGRQEDAEEFLGCVLNGIHDEMVAAMATENKPCNDTQANSLQNGDVAKDTAEHGEGGEDEDAWEQVGPKNKSVVTRSAEEGTPSLVSEIFRGQIRSILYQPNSKESATLQPFYTLQLEVHNTSVTNVSDALKQLVVAESLQGFTCARTKEEVDATRRIMLETLPPILILHLKWFVYDQKGGLEKRVKRVDFSDTLDISKDLLSPQAKAKLTNAQRTYKLVAVVNHHGPRALGGHYTTDVLHAGVQGWLHCDDSTIRPVKLAQVLNPEGAKVPYLIYYHRADLAS